jgi:phosphatidylinositol alpha-mannosyltransferase
MPLKIAIVTEYYYPLLGGITEHVHHTAKRLQAKGHSVTIITSEPGLNGVPAAEAMAPAAPVIRIGRSIPLSSNGSIAHATVGLHLWRDLRAVFLRERFDIAQLHSPLTFTLPALAVLASPCRSIGTFHTYFEGSRIYARLRHQLQKHLVDKLDGQTFVSQCSIDCLQRFFTLKDPRIIPNGVDLTLFNPSVPRLAAFDKSKRTLLFLGRFDTRNGLAIMIDAFARVRRRFPDVRLIVVGDGHRRAAFERRVPAALRDDVHFVGPAVASRPGYYATCDIFCSPVAIASFGMTLLEAMATGKPIVATDNVGYRDLLGPGEAVLVPGGSTEAFADAICALLADETRQKEMGASALRKAAQFSWDRVVEETLALYHEILGRP